MHPRSDRRPRRPFRPSLATLVGLALLAACGDAHEPSEDSVAVADIVAREAVPVITPGRAAELHATATSVGGAFDSVFRERMAPVALRLRGTDSTPPVVLDVAVTSLRLAGDSAEAVVHRRGHYRADTARFSSSDTRYRLVWQQEGGWRVAQTEPFNFQGEGAPPARARDVWWPKERD